VSCVARVLFLNGVFMVSNNSNLSHAVIAVILIVFVVVYLKFIIERLRVRLVNGENTVWHLFQTINGFVSQLHLDLFLR
jgi:hypothetical protein